MGKLKGFAPSIGSEQGKEKLKKLSDRIEQLLFSTPLLFEEVLDNQIEELAQKYHKQILDKQLVDTANKDKVASSTMDIQSVDINSIETEDVREIGAEWMCKQMLEAMEVPSFVKSCDIEGIQLQHCLINWISRMVHPCSEHATAKWLDLNSALGELIGSKHQSITRHHLYKAASTLYKKKDMLDDHLIATTRSMFNLQDKILLFDLTNTYFEGVKLNSKRGQFGRSKEKRSDAKLISLAMVVDGMGFYRYSKFYDGNVSEPGTLGDLLDHLDKKTGTPKALKPVVIMDAGIATEANIILLKEKGYDYLCVSRRTLKDYQLAEGENIIVHDKRKHPIEIKKVAGAEHDKELFVYVKSQQKEKKETSINTKLTDRFIQGLTNIKEALSKKRGTKSIDKVHERLGRLKQKYPRIHTKYKINVTTCKGKVTAVSWELQENKMSKDRERGVYFLRTSLMGDDEKQLWEIYNTLREVEDTFRTLKTDLHIRPVFHQKDKYSEAHLYLGILAYQVVSVIRHKLKSKGIHHCWSEIVRIMNSQKAATISMMKEDGNKIFIRTCSKPTAEAMEIYNALKLKARPFYRKRCSPP